MNGLKKEFAKYTSLNIIAMISLSCYILADTFFIANWIGAYGLAALNFALPVYGAVFGVSLMLGIGGATKYAIAISQKDLVQSRKIFSTTVWLMLGFASVFVITGIFFAGAITRAFGADGLVWVMSRTYLQVILISAPILMANSVLVCFIRNDGAPKLAMFSMVATSFTNIFLDYVFIRLLDMGMFGAALATTCASLVGFAIIMFYLLRGKGTIRLVPYARLVHVGGIFAIGLPSFVTEVSISAVLVVFNIIIFKLSGNMGVAAFGVIANIFIVIVSVYNGIAQGIQPLISKYYGLGEMAKAKLILRYALMLVAVSSAVVYAIVFFFAYPITMLFNSEQNTVLQDLATSGMRIYFIGGLFAGFNIIVAMYFTSKEHPRPAHIISTLRGFVIILPLVFLLSNVAGITGVWFTFPITELIVCGIASWVYWRRK